PALPEDVTPDEPISPPQGEMSRSDRGGSPAPTLGAELSEIGAVMGTLFGRWSVLNLVVGAMLVSFAGYAGGQFVSPYFLRTFHLSYGTVGLLVGLVAGVGQG